MSVLTEELRQKIQAFLPHYPHRQAVTLPALHVVQRVDEIRARTFGSSVVLGAEVGDIQFLDWRFGEEKIAKWRHCPLGEVFKLLERRLPLAALPIAQLGKSGLQFLKRQPGAMDRPANQFRFHGNGFGHNSRSKIEKTN